MTVYTGYSGCPKDEREHVYNENKKTLNLLLSKYKVLIIPEGDSVDNYVLDDYDLVYQCVYSVYKWHWDDDYYRGKQKITDIDETLYKVVKRSIKHPDMYEEGLLLDQDNLLNAVRPERLQYPYYEKYCGAESRKEWLRKLGQPTGGEDDEYYVIHYKHVTTT